MRRTAIQLLPVLLLLAGTVAAQAPDSVESIIEARELQTSQQPLRAHPRWAPRKVVVALSERMIGSDPDIRERFRRAAGELELVFDESGGSKPAAGSSLYRGADAVIGYCTPEVLEAVGESLVWLHSYSVGVDRCNSLDPALFAGRVFSNSKRLSGPTIAEHSIAMLLAIARGLPAYERAQRAEQWNRGIAGDERFGELAGKTLLVAGLGGIGTEVARRAHGLGMRVIATRNSSREGPDFVDYVGLADELGKLSAQAHVIVNALPLTDETRGLFDRAFFEGARPGAIFISVGRGASTVTEDLVAALRSGQLYGAGLDVTDPEPLLAGHPLWQMERVVITPHVAATGGDALQRVIAIAIDNLRRYASGGVLLNPVDMARGY